MHRTVSQALTLILLKHFDIIVTKLRVIQYPDPDTVYQPAAHHQKADDTKCAAEDGSHSS